MWRKWVNVRIDIVKINLSKHQRLMSGQEAKRLLLGLMNMPCWTSISEM